MRYRRCCGTVLVWMGLGAVFSALAGQQQESARKLLAVFAHPDDEITVAPVLARYAREGYEVTLALATSGQVGARPHAGIPAGEALGRAREEEARCSCRELGLQPPVFFRLWDGKVGDSMDELQEKVRTLFEEIRPEVVITWGGEGLYGHPDHRMVGNVVTQVFQSMQSAPGFLEGLFYPGIAVQRLEQVSAPPSLSIHPVRAEYLPVRIRYTPEDFARFRRAFACHGTQFTAEERPRLVRFLEELEEGVSYLRPWTGAGEIQSDLFVP